MTTMRIKPSRRKKIFFFVSVLVLLTFIDFSAMIYQKISGNGQTFVKHYLYSISGDSLLTIINRDFQITNKTKDVPIISSISPDKNKSGYTYVRLYIKSANEYIHMWVRTSQKFSEGTEIIFYGISNSPDYSESRIINRDYDLISREMIVRKFERLVIHQLNKRLGDD